MSYQSTPGPTHMPPPSTTTREFSMIIWFDKNYINSNEGLLKIVTVILNLAAFIVAQFAPYFAKVGFFCFTTMTAFWVSITLFGLYAFHVVERLNTFPWILAEFAFSIVWSVFFFLASILMLIGGGVQTIAAIFGFFACAIYGYEAKRNYMRYSNHEVAQGEQFSSQTIP